MRSTKYHLTALPALGDLGTDPPMALDVLRARFEDVPWARALVDTVLLESDLLERESFLAGELREVRTAVLAPAVVRGEAPLPEDLAPEDREAGLLGADRVWARYFRRSAKVAKESGCAFLLGWVMFEVGLRNALATRRARRLDLEASHFVVAEELSGSDLEGETIVERWAATEDPLAAQRELILGRWTWADRHDAWFTFRIDEIAAYAVKLVLLHGWRRVTSTIERRSA